jgi:signal recognition particle GTPase
MNDLNISVNITSNISSYINYNNLDTEINKLVLDSIITNDDAILLQTHNCNPHLSDLINILDKICHNEEVRKKILEYRYNIIKIDNEDTNKLRLSPSKLKKLLYNNSFYKYTKDQKIGIKNITEFLLNPNKKIFGFFGFAGTGKTTTLTTLVSQFVKLKMYKRIALVAPTNKAVMVMKNKFLPFLIELTDNTSISKSLSFDLIIEELKNKNIYIDFITIHKLLQIKTDFDNNGNMIFIPHDKPDIKIYDLIIIDECSMISIPMIDQILFEIRRNNIKLIFSGDPAQLPPINEKISSLFMIHKDDLTLHKYRDVLNRDKDKNKEIYTNEFINSFLKERFELFVNDILNMDKYTLTDVVRSKKMAVTKTCLSIRHWIENRFEFPPLEKYKDLEGVNFYHNIDNSIKTNTEWFKECLKNFKKPVNNNIIITWTNLQAQEYNNVIRTILFNKKDLNRFEKGDILILNDFYQIKNESVENINNSTIYTSEHIKVNTDVKLVNKKIILFSPFFEDEINFKKFKNDVGMRKKYNEFVQTILGAYKLIFKCYELNVVKIGEENISMKINVFHEDEIQNYEKILPFLHSRIKKFLQSISTDLVKEKQVNEYIGKPIWRHLHENLIEPFANVSYGYAITCHKAQGSNYYDVYVDASDIMKNNKESEMRRCLYTAFTRTVNELHVLF